MSTINERVSNHFLYDRFIAETIGYLPEVAIKTAIQTDRAEFQSEKLLKKKENEIRGRQVMLKVGLTTQTTSSDQFVNQYIQDAPPKLPPYHFILYY